MTSLRISLSDAFDEWKFEDVYKRQVDYSLDINYEHMADCTIEIKINAKNGTPFHLSETAK